MREVLEGIVFVGNQMELNQIDNNFNIVHAAKDPFHKSLVGYSGKNCPKKLYFYQTNERCSLCIIDFQSKKQWDYFPEEMLIKTMDFIDESILKGKKVFIHCNQGFSRGPSIAFMYLVSRNHITTNSLENDLKEFLVLYPDFNPGPAIKENIFRKHPFNYLRKKLKESNL